MTIDKFGRKIEHHHDDDHNEINKKLINLKSTIYNGLMNITLRGRIMPGETRCLWSNGFFEYTFPIFSGQIIHYFISPGNINVEINGVKIEIKDLINYKLSFADKITASFPPSNSTKPIFIELIIKHPILA